MQSAPTLQINVLQRLMRIPVAQVLGKSLESYVHCACHIYTGVHGTLEPASGALMVDVCLGLQRMPVVPTGGLQSPYFSFLICSSA